MIPHITTLWAQLLEEELRSGEVSHLVNWSPRFSLTTKSIKKIKKSFWGVYEYLHIDDPPTLASFDPPSHLGSKTDEATVSDRSGFQAIFHQTIIDTLQFQQGSKLQDVGEWSPFVMDTEPLVLSWVAHMKHIEDIQCATEGGENLERERERKRERERLYIEIMNLSSLLYLSVLFSINEATIPFQRTHHNLQIWLPHEVPSGTVSALPIASLPVANRHCQSSGCSSTCKWFLLC